MAEPFYQLWPQVIQEVYNKLCSDASCATSMSPRLLPVCEEHQPLLPVGSDRVALHGSEKPGNSPQPGDIVLILDITMCPKTLMQCLQPVLGNGFSIDILPRCAHKVLFRAIECD